MKYIIDIPEERHDWIMSHLTLDRNFRECKITPLPKGHGDLKDTQDIINKLNLNYNNHQTISEQSIKDIIQTIPTIIEADKG